MIFYTSATPSNMVFHQMTIKLMSMFDVDDQESIYLWSLPIIIIIPNSFVFKYKIDKKKLSLFLLIVNFIGNVFAVFVEVFVILFLIWFSVCDFDSIKCLHFIFLFVLFLSTKEFALKSKTFIQFFFILILIINEW